MPERHQIIRSYLLYLTGHHPLQPPHTTPNTETRPKGHSPQEGVFLSSPVLTAGDAAVWLPPGTQVMTQPVGMLKGDSVAGPCCVVATRESAGSQPSPRPQIVKSEALEHKRLLGGWGEISQCDQDQSELLVHKKVPSSLQSEDLKAPHKHS